MRMHMKRSPVRNDAGVTLLEVMGATFIILTVAIVLYGAANACFRLIAASRYEMASQSVAFDALWEELHREYEHFEDITTAVIFTNATPDASEFDGEGVVRVAVYPHGDYWEIEANVVWSNYMSRRSGQSYRVRRYRTIR
jgi:hypothetical protein